MFIKAEIFHLENAINNLLDNAKKYSKDPIIKLLTEAKNKTLYITIIDNGEGIAKKDKQRIFQKYYRVLDGNLYKVKGYGLGLSYVKKVVQNHKGKILLESEVGEGTKISIQLPLINHDEFR